MADTMVMSPQQGTKEDYRKQLQELYQKHCPDKVRKIDTLLATYEGREKHLINKPSDSSAEQSGCTTNNSENSADAEEKENSSHSTNKPSDSQSSGSDRGGLAPSSNNGTTTSNEAETEAIEDESLMDDPLTPPPQEKEDAETEAGAENAELVDVVYPAKGSLFIDLKARISDTYGASLKAFRTPPDGKPAVAEALHKAGRLHLGDVLVTLNGADVEEMLFVDLIKLVGKSAFPLTLQFRRPSARDARLRASASVSASAPGMRRKNSDRLSSLASAAEAFVFNTSQRHKAFHQAARGGAGSGGMPASSSSASSSSAGGAAGDNLIPEEVQAAFAKNMRAALADISDDFARVGMYSTAVSEKMKQQMAGTIGRLRGQAGTSEETQELLSVLESVVLQGGGGGADGGDDDGDDADADGTEGEKNKKKEDYQTDLVVARSGDRYVGGAEDAGKLRLAWYRASNDGKFLCIDGVTSGFYQPSADDVGSRVCLQCNLVAEPDLVNFAEIGPIALDPGVAAKVDELVAEGQARFKVTLRTAPEEQHVLVCDREKVSLRRVNSDAGTDGSSSTPFSVAGMGSSSSSSSSDSDSSSSSSDSKAGEGEGQGEEDGAAEESEEQEKQQKQEKDKEEEKETVELEAAFGASTQVHLDPVNVCCFSVVVGKGEGGTGRTTAQLLAVSPRVRDVIALTIRRLRAAAVGAEVEAEAAAAEVERNLRKIEVEENKKEEEKEGEEGAKKKEGQQKAAGKKPAPSSADDENEDEEVHFDATGGAAAAAADDDAAAPAAEPESEEERLRREHEALVSDHAALLRRHRQAERTEAGLRRKLRGLAVRWDESERGRQQLRSEREVVTTERDALRRRLKGATRRGAELGQAVAAGRAAAARQDSALTAARAETADVKRQLVEVSESCQVTASRLLQAEEKVKAADARYAACAAEVAGLRAAVRESDAESLTAEVSALRASEGEVKAALAEASADLETNKAEHAKLGKSLHELQRERGMMQAMIESRGKKLEEKTQRIAALEQEVARMRADEADPLASESAGLLKKQLLDRERQLDEATKAAAVVEKEKALAEEEAKQAQAEASKCQDSVSELTAQRNTLRRKAEGLAKDLKRLLQKGQALTFGGTVEGIEKCLDDHKQLQVEVQMHRGAHEAAVDELNEYKAALDGLVKKGGQGKNGGKGATVMEKARLADRLMEKHAQLEERTSGLNDRLKDKEMTLDHQLSTNRLLVKRIEELETQVQSLSGTTPASSCEIVVGKDTYTIDASSVGGKMAELPVSWLLSEAIRQHTEKHKMDDPGIIGLANARTGAELDLAANIGTCIKPGDSIRAILQ